MTRASGSSGDHLDHMQAYTHEEKSRMAKRRIER